MAAIGKGFGIFIATAMLAATLTGCNSDSDNSSSTNSGASGADSAVPSISGKPAGVAVVGTNYQFHPAATSASGKALAFTIKNQPPWSRFDTTTGALAGDPAATHIGSYKQIQIAVSDGVAVASLEPFSITVTLPAQVGTNAGLTIAGSPATSIAAGSAYRFVPSVSDTRGSAFTFSIKNKPAWATFSTSTGALTGTPAAANVGSSADIEITVGDGVVTAVLASFSIAVTASTAGIASLQWTAPAVNTDGTTNTDLAGYHIYYGTDPKAMTHVVSVDGAASTSYVIKDLALGTWYFAVAAYNTAKIESSLSAMVEVML